MTPAHVLAVYAEPLVAGRRVALLGPEDPSLIDAVVALGARLLYVYDPRPAVDGARRGADPRVTIAPLRAGDLGVREGAFDVALVPDLSLIGDPEAALAYIRRLVGSAGTAVIACRNAEASEPWTHAAEGTPPPTYTEFYDLCALQFAEVRMAGAAPFAAYAVAEFAPDREPAIAFDASLVTSPEPPEWFVAIASQGQPPSLEAYEIVQIPRDALAIAAPTTESGELDAVRARLAAIEQKLHEAEARAGEEALRADRAASELRTLRDRATRHAKELEEERKTRQRLEAEVDAARKNPELMELRERTLSLEAALIEARTQLATPRPNAESQRLQQELTAEVATLRSALQQREREIDASLARAKELEDRLAEQLAVADRDREARDELAARAERAETIAARLEAELGALQATHEHDVAALEGALRVAGEELRQAKHELARRERMVRELVAQVEDASAPIVVAPTVADVAPPRELLDQLELARRELATLVEEVRRRDRALDEAREALETTRRELEAERAKTERLARDAARREAALQTAAWRISELEKLGADSAPPVDVASELDALRRALAQEHARVEALERQLAASGAGDAGELKRVQARLQEQEALIAQLSAELAGRSDLNPRERG